MEKNLILMNLFICKNHRLCVNEIIYPELEKNVVYIQK